jgi:outer membrane protein
MKKITLLVLGLAVATVACNKDAGTDAAKAQPAGRIVYVNTDTLLNNYDYYKDVVKEFQNKQFQLENELQRKGQSFQNEVALFQRRVQAGGMSQEQAQTTQQQLAQKEQNLMMYRDNAANNLAVEQGQKTDELLTKIQDYLAKYNAGDKYDMVIGYSKGGGVLYAKEDLDITQDVLKGLNEEYAKTKKSTVKTDSTAKK